MAKKVKIVVKMLIKSGGANPAPPVGSALGPQGIQLKAFCDEFNKYCLDNKLIGMVPILVTVYDDRSYSIEYKIAPVPELIKQFAAVEKGASDPMRQKIGTLTTAQVRQIAEKKLPDLNCYTVDQAVSMVLGSCKSMGVKVVADDQAAQEASVVAA